MSFDKTAFSDRIRGILRSLWRLIEPCGNDHLKRRRTDKTGPRCGRWAAKRILFYTFEAGMCMKTNDRKTQCPKKIRLLGLDFRHFSITDTRFAQKCGFAMTICYVNPVFCRFLQEPRSGPPMRRRDVAQGPLSGLAAFPSITAIATRGKGRRAGERALRYAPVTTEGHSWPDKKSPLHLNAS